MHVSAVVHLTAQAPLMVLQASSPEQSSVVEQVFKQSPLTHR